MTGSLVIGQWDPVFFKARREKMYEEDSYQKSARSAYVVGKALVTEDEDFYVSDVSKSSDEIDAEQQRGRRFDSVQGEDAGKPSCSS